MIADLADERVDESHVSSLLAKVAAQFERRPFTPARFLTHGDLQTFGAYLWPTRFRLPDTTGDEERFFEVEPASRVLGHCRWQMDRTEHPTLVLWHGLEGSATSPYMLATAAKAFERGFNVVRMNVRNCGGTEHLTPTLYHGGLTTDLRVVIEELINQDRLPRIVIAGFSLGGNLTLKLAGEYADEPPAELKAVATVSPSIDLQATCDVINHKRNVVYHRNFLYYLKQRLRVKKKLFPDLYDTTGLQQIRSIVEFDDRYVAPAFGFANARDYYAKASAKPFLKHIRIPTLIIHAQDDPFIPLWPIQEGLREPNPHILLIAPPRGGHVAFISANSDEEDRFWAENRLVDFCELATS
jgi:uncharacterized protein